MTRAIDLNADMGEYADDEQRLIEHALMPLITSCSIACGGHAGDEGTMRATARLAKQHGVNIGAHPSYPDREGFGRRSLSYVQDELLHALQTQISTLISILDTEDITLRHVKPHGALYNDAAKTPKLAGLVAQAVKAVSANAVLLGPPGSALEGAAQDHSLSFAAEGFVDRLYKTDGSLTPRGKPGAIIENIAARAAQALAIAHNTPIKTADGELLLTVKTLCIHSDSPGAVETAIAARAALTEDRIAIKAIS